MLKFFKSDMEQLLETLSNHSTTVHGEVKTFLSNYDEKQKQIRKSICEFIDKIDLDMEKVKVMNDQIEDRQKLIKQCVEKI